MPSPSFQRRRPSMNPECGGLAVAPTTADFFNPLIRHIEDLVLDSRAPYPVERALLTSGMTLAAVDSIHQGYVPVNTPEMAVAYRAPKASLFWRS
jgi:hypothetical protein